MNKESFFLYIFRLILSIGLFVFMCLLYWSSSLLELNVRGMRNEINELRSSIDTLQSTLVNGAVSIPNSGVSTSAHSTASNLTPEIASEYPNLLQEDPFYKVTLPKMLGPNFHPSGTFRDSTYGKSENLHPFSGFVEPMRFINLCNISVADNKFGIYETMSPAAAYRLEERKNEKTGLPEFWVFLRRDLFWEPLEQHFFNGSEVKLAPHFLKRHPVTAHDFKFYYDAFMNNYVTEAMAISARTTLGDIEAIDIIDDYTFVVRWKGHDVTGPDGKVTKQLKYKARLLTGALSPLASFVFKYFADGTKIVEDDSAPDTYQKSSVWAQNFSQHWAKNIIPSCGAWKFDGMTDQRIRLKRNDRFFEPLANLMQVYEQQFKSSPDAMWQDFKAGNTIAYSLVPDKLPEWEQFKKSSIYAQQVAKNQAIHELQYLSSSFAYIGWNNSHPIFGSKKVRQAMTMAIDRRRIIRQNLNNLGIEIHGPFLTTSDAIDPSITPWPFDPQAARKLLEEEGWSDMNGDGILDKVIDGKVTPFTFAMTYYVKNPTTKSIVEYVATALKEIGVQCELNGVDIADLTTKIDDKTFDAYYLSWMLSAPPDDPSQLWLSTYAKVKGSSNTIGFANQEADEVIEKLNYEYDKQKRIELYHRLDQIFHEEQPYTFLFTSKTLFLYRESLQNVFVPADHQDLIPGANIPSPQFSAYWIKEQS